MRGSARADARPALRGACVGLGPYDQGVAREDEKIPTSRVRRTTTVATLAASEAVKQFGTHAANLTRGEEAADEASDAVDVIFFVHSITNYRQSGQCRSLIAPRWGRKRGGSRRGR